MIGKANFELGLNVNPLRNQRVATIIVVLLLLTLQCFAVHAELVFRSVEQVNGQPRWSPVRKYSNPSDIAYARVFAGGAAALAEEVRVFLSGEINLEGISPSSEDMADAASARRLNLSMFDYLQRKAKLPACAFFDAGPGRCEGKVQEAATRGGMADDPGNLQTGEAASAGRANSIPAARLNRLKKPTGVSAY